MTHDQKASEEKGKALQDEREALKQKARDVQERASAHRGPNDPGGDQVPRPAPDDPRYGQPSTQADQVDVPTGSTTGSAMGGSANRKKDHAG
jgi:hypothetical protein